MIIASEEGVKRNHLTARARIISAASSGVEPAFMGIGPVPASLKALKIAGITIKDIDIIEINEAFAAQGLASLRSLGIEDDDERVNPNGGAIALGHPLGMSGTSSLIRGLIGFTFLQNSFKGCGCLRDQSKNPVTPSLYERDDKDCIDSPWRN